MMLRLISIARANIKLHRIRLLSGKAFVILAAAVMSNMTGCGDPVRTTSQNITIIVENAQRLPVPDVKVRIKESWESWQSWNPEEIDKEGWESFYRNRWKSDFVPWLEGMTNTEGSAVLRLVVTALDTTKGSEPPAKRDMVSNREYIVKIKALDAEEEFLVVMKPGTVSSGKRFTVRIEAIERPRYRKR